MCLHELFQYSWGSSTRRTGASGSLSAPSLAGASACASGRRRHSSCTPGWTRAFSWPSFCSGGCIRTGSRKTEEREGGSAPPRPLPRGGEWGIARGKSPRPPCHHHQHQQQRLHLRCKTRRFRPHLLRGGTRGSGRSRQAGGNGWMDGCRCCVCLEFELGVSVGRGGGREGEEGFACSSTSRLPDNFGRL